MKNKPLILVAMFIFIGINIYAQSNVIKTSPLRLAVKDINLQYERALGNRISLQIGGSFRLNEDNQFSYEAGPRIYFSERVKKFYLYPHVVYQKEENENLSIRIDKYTLGAATVGYQAIIFDALAIDTGIGLEYIIKSNNIDIIKLVPALHLRVGYAF